MVDVPFGQSYLFQCRHIATGAWVPVKKVLLLPCLNLEDKRHEITILSPPEAIKQISVVVPIMVYWRAEAYPYFWVVKHQKKLRSISNNDKVEAFRYKKMYIYIYMHTTYNVKTQVKTTQGDSLNMALCKSNVKWNSKEKQTYCWNSTPKVTAFVSNFGHSDQLKDARPCKGRQKFPFSKPKYSLFISFITHWWWKAIKTVIFWKFKMNIRKIHLFYVVPHNRLHLQVALQWDKDW